MTTPTTPPARITHGAAADHPVVTGEDLRLAESAWTKQTSSLRTRDGAGVWAA